MKSVGSFKKLTVETQGSFTVLDHTFLHSTINEIFVHCKKDATFDKQAFQQTPSLTNLTVISDDDISFLQTKINSILLIANGSISFGKQSFQGCLQLTTFVIHTPENVVFDQQAFHKSQVHEIIISSSSSSSNSMEHATSTVTFEKQSFAQCEQLTNVDIKTNGNVEIQSKSFKNSKSLNNVKIDIDGTATADDFAFSGCNSLGEADIKAGHYDISDNAYANGGDDGDGGKKKKSGSSHKDDDDDSQTNAKVLGNIEIQSAYLGTSSNLFLIWISYKLLFILAYNSISNL